MRRDFFGAGRRHDVEPRAPARRRRSASSTTTSTSATATAIARLVRETRPDLDRPLRRPAVARPRRVAAVRRLRRQRRRHAQPARGRAPALPESPFVFLSTNKVYGDAPNELPLVELETRWDYADPAAARAGSTRRCRIDATLHSLFGASKAAADLLVQEYGRYFGMPTVCFRGGCLTGPHHSGAELHGFLAYLARARPRGPDVPDLRLQGQAGARQHPLARRLHARSWPSPSSPRPAAVYNLGGGRANSVSMLEAIARLRGAARPPARDRVRRGAAARRPHLLHQRLSPLPHRLSRVGAHDRVDEIFAARGASPAIARRAIATGLTMVIPS